MNGKRVYTIQRKAICRLIDIYSQGRIFKLTSQQIDFKVRDLFNSLPKETPRYVKSYIRGYHDALTQELYNHYLDFRYIINGQQVSTYKNSPIYYEKMGITVAELTNNPNGHYWKDSNKPYFNDEVHEAYKQEGR